mmetsp:Transcript_38115/g.96466  ORF Transcript_38115/g.96466 Transcript_38115/m.96466 type:complete len:751 (+) Transcript_38115:369-2621(+)
MEEWHALPQRHKRQRHAVHLELLGQGQPRPALQDDLVVERLVVVAGGVVDALPRLARVGGRHRPVQHLHALDGPPKAVLHHEVPQAAGEAQPQPVAVLHEPLQLVQRAALVEVGAHLGGQPRDDALQPRVLERSAPNHRIPKAVVEGAKAHAVDIELAGVVPPPVARHLAKVPGLPVQVHAGAVHAVRLQRQRADGVPHLAHRPRQQVPHDVKPVAVHLVRPRPVHAVIDHHPLAHEVLRGRVVAAAGVQDLPRLPAAVVVAGNDLVQHGVHVVRAGLVGVVVHHVQHHAQAQAVQALHHLPELQHAAAAVRVRRVAPLRHAPVHGVVPPVVRVLGRNLHDALLLLFALRCAGLHLRRRRAGLVLRPLGHRAKVVGGKQVQVGDPRARQARQVLHARGLRLAKREVLAAQRGGHAVVRGAEVADVQLVDGHVREPAQRQRRAGLLLPALGRQLRVSQVHKLRAQAVCGQGARVRVGGLRDLHLLRPGAVHCHPERVVLPLPGGRPRQVPDPLEHVVLHGQHLRLSAARSVPQQQLHALRRWRPQRDVHALRPHARAQRAVVEEALVQHARDLQPRGLDCLVLRAMARHDHLPPQHLRDLGLRQVRHLQVGAAPQVRRALHQLLRQVLVQRCVQRDAALRAIHQLILRGHARLGRGVQRKLVRRTRVSVHRGQPPRDGACVEPVRRGAREVAKRHARDVRRTGVHLVCPGHQPQLRHGAPPACHARDVDSQLLVLILPLVDDEVHRGGAGM